MKKFVIIGILLSLFGASIDAQEKKEIKISTTQEKFTWDVISPVYSEGDTLSWLEIATERKIEAIAFEIEWHLKDSTIIIANEKAVIRHGSIPWTNDLPKIFPKAMGISYNLYILPGPPVSPWEVEKIKFRGWYRCDSVWNNMGHNEVLCHQQGLPI